MIKNSEKKWGLVAQSFHWGIVALFLGMWLVAEQMEELAPDAMLLGFSKWDFYALHKATGTLILCLVLLRLVWRLLNKTPTEGEVSTPLQRKAASLVHLGLYGVMLGMPLSGYVMSMAGGHPYMFFGLFDVPNLVGVNPQLASLAHTMHGLIWNVFIGLICVHVGAAFYHQHVLKDNVLKRMMPSFK